MTRSFDRLNRRTVLRTGAAAGAVLGGGLGLPALAATAPSIPEVTVRAGAVAYTNHAWVVLAAQKGFLADVGITMEGNAPRILRDQQIVPQLQNDELDISTMYFGLITQAIDKITNIKPVLSYSYWQGNTILTSPNQGYKTVDEFMAEGQPWEEAAASAMRQLEGRKFAVTANPSTYPWNDFAFSLAGLQRADPLRRPRRRRADLSAAISSGLEARDEYAPNGRIHARRPWLVAQQPVELRRDDLLTVVHRQQPADALPMVQRHVSHDGVHVRSRPATGADRVRTVHQRQHRRATRLASDQIYL
jgi:hypothetical protein